MSRRLFVKTCFLLAITTHVRTQYIDFFQNFNTFLQPFTSTKPNNAVTKRPSTKHRHTNKPKSQDIIVFEDDISNQKDNLKLIDPFNFYSTTTKPRRKSTKTSSHTANLYTSTTTKPANSNKIHSNININHESIRSINNNNYGSYNYNGDNKEINNDGKDSRIRQTSYEYVNNFNNRQTTQRPIDYYNNRQTTPRTIDNYNNRQTTQRTLDFNNWQTTQKALNYYNNRQTTQPPVDYNNRQTTQRTIDYYNNRQTTQPPVDYNNRQTTQRTIDYYNNRQTTQRPIDYNNRQTTQRTTDYYNNRKTTQKSTTDYYFNERTTRKSYNAQTTSNPLLNRPGVIPAVVNDNKPPITNRPVTESAIYDKPFGFYNPVNTRPSYEVERTTKRPETRPANTRPPYENERPSVHRPISGIRPDTSGNRPVTSGNRPVTSGFKPVTSGNRPEISGTKEDEEPEIEIGPDEDEMSEAEKRRLYDICEQKCEEYQNARVKKVVALPLMPNPQGVELNVSTCTPANNPLILGGDVVKIEEFPHMALVGWKKIDNGGYSWKCGGSLLSESYVLTAGHCTFHDKDANVVRYNGPPHAVRLGSSLLSSGGVVARVSLVVRHPKYKLRRSYYDVALLKLAIAVTFSDKISPACLGVPPSVGEPVIATGWGKTEFGGDSSIELRSVSIPIWDMSECRDIWGTSLKLPNGPMPDNQVCAGERKGAKDTCQGDSGGPAQVAAGCAWRVVAITSVGRSCGAPQTPALYATVPRAFVAAQVYTNMKTGRDTREQSGNEGVNNNNGHVNNNWSNGNNDNGYNQFEYNTNNQFGNRGVANIRPVENTNYNNGHQINNNKQYIANTGNYQEYNNGNNQQTTFTSSNNNRHNNNGYISDQKYHTSTEGYQNYNQNGFNQENNHEQTDYYNQNVRNTESDIRNYGTQSSGYNGHTNNGYNRDNDNGYNSYAFANRPWWSR